MLGKTTKIIIISGIAVIITVVFVVLGIKVNKWFAWGYVFFLIFCGIVAGSVWLFLRNSGRREVPLVKDVDIRRYFDDALLDKDYLDHIDGIVKKTTNTLGGGSSKSGVHTFVGHAYHENGDYHLLYNENTHKNSILLDPSKEELLYEQNKLAESPVKKIREIGSRINPLTLQPEPVITEKEETEIEEKERVKEEKEKEAEAL